jgi:hypothetical protein
MDRNDENKGIHDYPFILISVADRALTYPSKV